MRYSILGFNQQKLVELQTDTCKLDMTDVLLMNYIQTALSQPSMIKTTIRDQSYVWLNHNKILEDLPILNIKESMLRKHLSKLIELELIQTSVIANEHNRGSRTYYTITSLFESLQFSDVTTSDKKLQVVEMNSDKKLQVVARADVKNYCSDNKLLSNDNKLKKPDKRGSDFNFGKVFDSEVKKIKDSESVDSFVSLYNEHCFNLPKVVKLTDKRRKAINAILKKYSTDEIIQAFDLANESDFLIGKNDRGWKADIDFILREDKFINILEGKYGGRKRTNTSRASSDMGRANTQYTAEQRRQFKEALRNGEAERI